jgi:uncharacterized damage-inducible protein DinB
MPRPKENEFTLFYKNYVDKTEGHSIEDLIQNYSKDIIDFIQILPIEKQDFAYAENKWTVKDLLQHLIDAERVFVYRATRFSRKDKTDLPGFNENDYAKYANASNKNFDDLKNEMIYLRKSTDLFLQNLTQAQLIETGTANGNEISVNAIAFIIFGHFLHHKNILKERYL